LQTYFHTYNITAFIYPVITITAPKTNTTV